VLASLLPSIHPSRNEVALRKDQVESGGGDGMRKEEREKRRRLEKKRKKARM